MSEWCTCRPTYHILCRHCRGRGCQECQDGFIVTKNGERYETEDMPTVIVHDKSCGTLM